MVERIMSQMGQTFTERVQALAPTLAAGPRLGGGETQNEHEVGGKLYLDDDKIAALKGFVE